MHDYAQQAAPAALNRVMDHPDMQQALSQQGVSGWGGDQEQGRQAGGYADQSGYGKQGLGTGADQPAQYGDQGGYQQGGYPQDQGGYGDRGGYQQDAVGDPGQYQQGDYPEGRPGSSHREEGYQQGGQFAQEDAYRQDQGGY